MGQGEVSATMEDKKGGVRRRERGEEERERQRSVILRQCGGQRNSNLVR